MQSVYVIPSTHETEEDFRLSPRIDTGGQSRRYSSHIKSRVSDKDRHFLSTVCQSVCDPLKPPAIQRNPRHLQKSPSRLHRPARSTPRRPGGLMTLAPGSSPARGTLLERQFARYQRVAFLPPSEIVNRPSIWQKSKPETIPAPGFLHAMESVRAVGTFHRQI